MRVALWCLSTHRSVRTSVRSSLTEVDENGDEYTLFSFDEALPHHALYVEKCFRGFDHFYETRADNSLLEFVQSFEKRATLPCALTCEQHLLECFEELVDEKIMVLIQRHKDAFGTPCAASTTDIWSLSSCRESFACLRGSFVLDGDMVLQVRARRRFPPCPLALTGSPCPLQETRRSRATTSTRVRLSTCRLSSLSHASPSRGTRAP